MWWRGRSVGSDDLTHSPGRRVPSHDMASQPSEKRPAITYPCQWGFRIIGTEETALRASVTDVLDGEPHTIRLGNASSGGRYRSLHLEITVRDEAHRNAIFSALQSHHAVKYVL